MLAFYDLKTTTWVLTVGISIVGAVSACHSNTVALPPSAIEKVAQAASGPNGLMDAELTPPFDETPITPRETVGATIEPD